jgi:hypothetical protein
MKSELKMFSLDQIEPEAVSWIWKPFIAIGKICLVQGDPGVGKSTSVLAIVAEVTRGTMPGETDLTAPANVIYQNAEDSYHDTIRPNLERFGADYSRVHVIDERDCPLTLDDDRIERAIIEKGAKMFIADPLTCYTQGTDTHSAKGMRPLMKRLCDVAERTGCAVVLVNFLNKSGGKSVYRGLGSIDIYAAARSVLTVGKLPLDESMRAIVHTKSNLAPLGKSQAFGLDENGGFCWLGDCDATVDEVMSGKPKAESQFTKARRLLETKLAHGAVAAVEIMELAENEGISFKTFKRVKDALGVISFKRGGQWFWDLPIEVVYEDCSQEVQNSQGVQANALVPLDFYAPQSQ